MLLDLRLETCDLPVMNCDLIHIYCMLSLGFFTCVLEINGCDSFMAVIVVDSAGDGAQPSVADMSDEKKAAYSHADFFIAYSTIPGSCDMRKISKKNLS